jgi:hypothetical protein
MKMTFSTFLFASHAEKLFFFFFFFTAREHLVDAEDRATQ